jgi:hypothetical protein
MQDTRSKCGLPRHLDGDKRCIVLRKFLLEFHLQHVQIRPETDHSPFGSTAVTWNCSSPSSTAYIQNMRSFKYTVSIRDQLKSSYFVAVLMSDQNLVPVKWNCDHKHCVNIPHCYFSHCTDCPGAEPRFCSDKISPVGSGGLNSLAHLSPPPNDKWVLTFCGVIIEGEDWYLVSVSLFATNPTLTALALNPALLRANRLSYGQGRTRLLLWIASNVVAIRVWIHWGNLSQQTKALCHIWNTSVATSRSCSCDRKSSSEFRDLASSV